MIYVGALFVNISWKYETHVVLYTQENDSDLLEQVGVLIGHYKKVFHFV